MKSLPPNSNNFFALFNQPVQFDINESALDNRLRELQKQYHPDNKKADDTQTLTSTPSQTSAKQATQGTTPLTDSISALINHAYQTLKSPDLRATYLLEMVEQAEELDNSIADLDFLEDAMSLRMDLEDAIDAQDSTILNQLHTQVNTLLQAQASRFDLSYQQQDWQPASDATQKLKFLVKLDADINKGLDKIATSASHDDDDDLYV